MSALNLLYYKMYGYKCTSVWIPTGIGAVVRAAKIIFGPQGKRKLGPPPPILQIMILKLSPPPCVISKELVQQKWIDELWFRKQLSTCLFVWTLNYNDLVHLLNSWAPGRRPGWPPSQWVWSYWYLTKLCLGSGQGSYFQHTNQCQADQILENQNYR